MYLVFVKLTGSCMSGRQDPAIIIYQFEIFSKLQSYCCLSIYSAHRYVNTENNN